MSLVNLESRETVEATFDLQTEHEIGLTIQKLDLLCYSTILPPLRQESEFQALNRTTGDEEEEKKNMCD